MEQQNAIRCLSLPLQDSALLVPGAVVSEVVPYVSHTPIKGDDTWLLGRLIWRGLALPLISFEVAATLAERPAIGRRIAVFNTVGGNPELPFYAIFIQAVPHLMQLDEHRLTELDGEMESPILRNRVEFDGQQAFIPELDKFESLVLSTWSQSYDQ